MACYFPDCSTPVIFFVNGEPVCNVQIAHVRKTNPNSSRYDPSMTDAERRAFTNLILLCTPYHTIVDRLHSADYPPEELQRWKMQREADAGIDNIALSSLTDTAAVVRYSQVVCAGQADMIP